MVNKFFKDKIYKKLFEDSKDEILQSFMREEKEVIERVRNSKKKTFIDLGAGHGRLTPFLSEISKKVISIEINKEMIPTLIERSSNFKNSEVVEGNIVNFKSILRTKNIEKPVLLLLQNTLSVLEKGDCKKLVDEMSDFSRKNKGEIIISLTLARALARWGLKLYTSTKEMTGEPDLKKSDLKRGLFVSKKGYRSKWYSLKEIEEIKSFLGGNVVKELITPNYYILHISYS